MLQRACIILEVQFKQVSSSKNQHQVVKALNASFRSRVFPSDFLNHSLASTDCWSLYARFHQVNFTYNSPSYVVCAINKNVK